MYRPTICMETEPHMNRSRTLILPALLALTLSACGGGDAASDTPSEEPVASVAASEAAEPSEAAAPSEDASGGRNVTLTDFAFSEGELTIAAGTTVTFRNSGSAPHTVTEGTDGVEADGSSFNEQLAPGDEAEITFDEAGTFDVTCLLHPQMNMTVVVEG
jgi:plastocyanin